MQYAQASLRSRPGALQVVLGEPGAQIAAADHELLGALAGLAVLRVVTATVGAASIANAYSQLAMCARRSASAVTSRP